MLSLAKLDARIGDKQREMAEIAEKRNALYSAMDETYETVESLEADEKADPAELKSAIDSYKKAERESANLSDKIRSIESELTSLKAQRSDREEANRQEASLNKPADRKVDAEAPKADETAKPRVLPETDAEKDHAIASFVRNTFIAKSQGTALRAVCRGDVGDQYKHAGLEAAITTSNNASLLPENYQPRLIELLRPRVVVRQMQGLRQIPLLNGNLRLPRQNSSSTAAYSGELANIAVSQPGTDQITLAAKKLTSMVVQSGEMMRRADPSTDRMILDDIVQVIARKEDATFLRATGSATVPTGLKDFCDNGVGRVITQNATVNLQNIKLDLGKLILALYAADAPMLNPYFIFTPRVHRFLMDYVDGNGNPAFPEMRDGMLRGYPFLTTTQIPNNLDASGAGNDNETEIYFVDASEFIVADAPTFELNVSTEAAYHDGSNVQAAFSQDAVVFRSIVEHDTALRHTESAAYMEAVTWGA